MEEKYPIRKYFAAANGYNGFTSYFGEVFSSYDYSRIYVLKGGPGTGKSSFMRSMSKHLSEKGCHIEEIYCSSDPNSLDGLIAEKDKRRIAIIDGTAPHERDAVIPGAIDEIINLGDNWDTRVLSAQRDNILELSQEKTDAYRTAYSYLALAGRSAELIRNIYEPAFDKIEAKIKAEELLGNIAPSDGQRAQRRIISSFGRLGSYSLGLPKGYEENTVKICGEDETVSMLFCLCHQLLLQKGAKLILCPAALDAQNYDAIVIPNEGLSLVRASEGDIDADEFLISNKLSRERVRVARTVKSAALDEAKRWFAIASDLHFRLEKIYTAAMSFEKNNEILRLKMIEIDNILEILEI